MKKILVIFGTRPEAIKLAPVIYQLKKEKKIKTIVCSTGQHREMLKQVLDIFKLKIDHDLDLMKPNQDLYDITVHSTAKLKKVLKDLSPHLMLVQGDTTTAFVSALSAFYSKIKIGHVEAGLRSYNIYSPYPEEANRRFISVLTDLHFAPTQDARQNLLSEGIPDKKIFVTGNTVIDALLQVKKMLEVKSNIEKISKSIGKYLPANFFQKESILITMHRREKFGDEFRNVLMTLKKAAAGYPQYNFIYPVHLNPNVKQPVKEILEGTDNFLLLPPLDYMRFIFLMSKCRFIITDSGGVQEECYVFKKPVIVMRDVTERNEAVRAGYAFLTGSNAMKFKTAFSKIENALNKGENLFKTKNPFGDGRASRRIVDVIKKSLSI
jgi:UDP-N-acetylglucosamine 2-epimerase (non-hydrolysing)